MISIIIPCYNRATLIGYTLDSLLKQTYQDWECIIVDDGSTDDTKAVVQTYLEKDTRFSFFERPATMPKGANSCRNLGLQKAQRPFVKWLDSDDLIIEDCLEMQLNLIKDRPEIKVCFSYAQYFNDATGALEGMWSRKMKSDNYLYDHIINQIRWPTGAILWRRDFLPAEPYLPTLKNAQEWLMHSIALTRLKQDECINVEKIVHFNRRAHLRMSSNTSPNYYFNQAKSRYYLLIALLKANIYSPKMSYQLFKQIGIYLFQSLKKMV